MCEECVPYGALDRNGVCVWSCKLTKHAKYCSMMNNWMRFFFSFERNGTIYTLSGVFSVHWKDSKYLICSLLVSRSTPDRCRVLHVEKGSGLTQVACFGKLVCFSKATPVLICSPSTDMPKHWPSFIDAEESRAQIRPFLPSVFFTFSCFKASLFTVCCRCSSFFCFPTE